MQLVRGLLWRFTRTCCVFALGSALGCPVPDAPDAASATDAVATDQGAVDASAGGDRESPGDASRDGAAASDARLTDATVADITQPDTANALPCDQLASISAPSAQVASVVADGSASCTDRFVELLISTPARYVDAFVQLVPSSASSPLFYSCYAAMSRMQWDKPVIDVLYAGLPAAVAAVSATWLRDNWANYFLAGLERGEFYRCPAPLPATGSGLLAELGYTGYSCTESVAQALAPLLDQAALDALLDLAQHAPRGWTRRNGWRSVGRLAEQPAGQQPRLLLDQNATAIRATAVASLQSDRYADALHDAIWVLDAGFFPTFEALPPLQAISLDAGFDSSLRFRAAAAASRLITARTGTVPQSDVDYLISALASDDFWVRAEAAYTCERLSIDGRAAASGDESRLAAALQAAYDAETNIVARAYQARAIDQRTGSSLYPALRQSYEASHLATTQTGTGFTIRSGLASGAVAALVVLLETETTAFYELLGNDFTAPVAGDANATAVVVVFATMAEYQDYMNAFVGYAAYAGGLYLEGSGTLYTFERTPQESTYTLEELLQHEYAHRLQARHVFPGLWGDSGYFDQAKGWADEGSAEFFAGIVFSGSSYDADPLRLGPLGRICGQSFSDLATLLTLRAGYDEYGTFDYDNAWAFIYFMQHARQTSLLALRQALRADTYAYANWTSIAGVSVADLQTEWHAALDGYCTQAGFRAAIAPRTGPTTLRLRGDEIWLGRGAPAGVL